MAKYDAAYMKHLQQNRDNKRRKAEATAEREGLRYCASRTHYVPIEQVTRRRGGKTGPWICDFCFEQRKQYMRSRK